MPDGLDKTKPADYGTYITPLGNTWASSAWATAGRVPGERHFDGGNWLYVDGHVKFLKLGATNYTGPDDTIPYYYWRIRKNASNEF